MLVDNDKAFVIKMINLLKSYDYKGCRPKKILEQMNVLDITRTQVASHL
ncbi:hypothetical protein RDI58_010908 [Solanum bulbocastanum]|uniref:Uncharacterized protein n=1 Tax=Solanum bulbocastanum TaxID=147425 RepID=A0AAN8TVC9_SOLBU